MLLQMRRRWALRKAVSALASDWLGAVLPSGGSAFSHLHLVAIDLETTGLDARRDAIVSVGWVEIRRGVIELDTARHYFVRSDVGVGQSATVHQIRDTDLTRAYDLSTVLEVLLRISKGAVLVFHHASLDMAFLNKACHHYFKMPLLAQVVDTLMLERKRFARRDQPSFGGEFRLGACRTRYNLPVYQAHNALSDALATAELLLAMVARAGQDDVILRDLLG